MTSEKKARIASRARHDSVLMMLIKREGSCVKKKGKPTFSKVRDNSVRISRLAMPSIQLTKMAVVVLTRAFRMAAITTMAAMNSNRVNASVAGKRFSSG